jgi:4-hydroxybenzoate polyprenyltransferase
VNFHRLREYLSLIRFSHTLFALPFALFSALIAWSHADAVFRWQDLVGIVACMVFARSAAMSFNRYADRHLDAENPRTMGRHLPAGLMSERWVVVATVVCCLGFLASTLLFLPKLWPVRLSVPVLGFLLCYSFAKRWTTWCHYWLSTALMLSPIAAWIAVADALDWPPVLLGCVVFFWVGGFDIIYACQDYEFDRQRRLRSVPVRWGIPTALRIAWLSHLAMLICLVGLYYVAGLGPIFLAGVVVITGLLAYEHWLVSPDDLSRVNLAFFHVNSIISVGILIVGAIDLWLC